MKKTCSLCGVTYGGHENSLYCDSCRKVMEKRNKSNGKNRHDPMGWYWKIVADQKAGKYHGTEGANVASDYGRINQTKAKGVK